MPTRETRKRQFLFFLPVLVIPMVTLLFWQFGGGGKLNDTVPAKGLNLQLPEPVAINREGWTKLDYYKRAEQDSARRRALAQSDGGRILPGYRSKKDSSADRLEAKLRDLERQLDRDESGLRYMLPAEPRPRTKVEEPGPGDERLRRKQQVMLDMEAPELTSDPEIDKLQETARLLAGLEQPELPTTAARVDTAATLPVKLSKPQPVLSKFDTQFFYGLNTDAPLTDSPALSLIPALIAQNQVVTAGQTVALRLQAPVTVGPVVVSAQTTVYALAGLSKNRLQLTVSSVLYHGRLLPVDLTAYDAAGLEGLPIRSADLREAVQDPAQKLSGRLSLGSLAPSLEGQLAEVGVQTARSLFKKKSKTISVRLFTGDQVWLVDNRLSKRF